MVAVLDTLNPRSMKNINLDPDSNLFVPTLCEPYGILYVDAINCYMNEKKKKRGNTIQQYNTI